MCCLICILILLICYGILIIFLKRIWWRRGEGSITKYYNFCSWLLWAKMLFCTMHVTWRGIKSVWRIIRGESLCHEGGRSTHTSFACTVSNRRLEEKWYYLVIIFLLPLSYCHHLSALLIIATEHQAGHLVRRKSVAWGLSRTLSARSSASGITASRDRWVQGALGTHFH